MRMSVYMLMMSMMMSMLMCMYMCFRAQKRIIVARMNKFTHFLVGY